MIEFRYLGCVGLVVDPQMRGQYGGLEEFNKGELLIKILHCTQLNDSIHHLSIEI